MVAWMTLCGFDVPMHLVRMSWMPGDLEHRAHRAAGDDAGPGAGRPQEHRAGAEVPVHLVRDRAALTSGILNRFFFACSVPLRMASGTSLALPRPAPT